MTLATTTAPGPVTGLSALPSSTSIALSWTNPPQTSLTGVMIRRAAGATAPASVTDGTPVADVVKPAATLTDSGLTPGTYSYALFAYDGAAHYGTAATVTSTMPLSVITTVLPGGMVGQP